MADENLYLGRPGALFTLPMPRGNLVGPRERPRWEFDTASGGKRIGELPGGKRRYVLRYDSLPLEVYSWLDSVHQGTEGPGPFAFIDPGRRNQLTANQSGATSERNSTTGFTASIGALTSDSVTFRRGPRSLKWTFSATTAGTVDCASPSSLWYGVPTFSGRSQTFGFWALGAGSDAIVTLGAQIRWLTTTGSVVSTSSGSTAATNSSTWTQYTVTATAPATAAFAMARVNASAGISNGSILYLDQLQLEEGSTANAWVPGTGVVPVQPVTMTDEWPWGFIDYRRGADLVLQEVGSA
jgi:hypothetical protein